MSLAIQHGGSKIHQISLAIPTPWRMLKATTFGFAFGDRNSRLRVVPLRNKSLDFPENVGRNAFGGRIVWQVVLIPWRRQRQ
jgi:hypothetical protein